MLSSVAVVLAIRGLLPVWAVAILVGRDLLALLGSLVVGSKIRVNRVGKAATAVLMGAVALVVISPGVVGEVIFYAGFGLSIVAGLIRWRMRESTGRGEALDEGDNNGRRAGDPAEAAHERPAQTDDPDSQLAVHGAHR